MSKVLGEKETVLIEFKTSEERNRLKELFIEYLQDIYDGWAESFISQNGVFRLGYSQAHPERLHGYSYAIAKGVYENSTIVKSEDIQHWSDLVKLGIGKVPEQIYRCQVEVSSSDQAKAIEGVLGGSCGASDPAYFPSGKTATIYINKGKVSGWDSGRHPYNDREWVTVEDILYPQLVVKPKTKEDRQAASAAQPKCKCKNVLSEARVASGVDHCRACDKPSKPLWPGTDKIFIHKGNTDHIADALSYGSALHQQFETQPSKEDTMTGTSFETRHFINGADIITMTVDTFLNAITAKKAQIRALEAMEIESDVLNAQIALQNKDLALIIEKMEEIHG